MPRRHQHCDQAAELRRLYLHQRKRGVKAGYVNISLSRVRFPCAHFILFTVEDDLQPFVAATYGDGNIVGCLEATRLSLIEKVVNYVVTDASAQSKPFIWLTGPAGSGKSTASVANALNERNVFTASFFPANETTAPEEIPAALSQRLSGSSRASSRTSRRAS